MRRRRFLLASLSPLAIALGSTACTFGNSLGPAYAPPLWRAVPPDARSTYHLFGSVHLGYWRFYPLPQAIEAAWQRSRALFVELNSLARHDELVRAFGPYVRQPAGRDLANEIGQPTFARLKTLLKADYNETLRIQGLRPWAVALQLQSDTDKTMQADHKQGIDAYFIESANRKKIPIIELESPQEQVQALGGGNSQEQVAALIARMDAVEKGDAVLQEIVEAWRIGDVARLDRLREQHFPQTGPLANYRQRVLLERDERLALRLDEHARRSAAEEFFVVVGTMHLLGQASLVDRLKARGWRVERVPSA